MWKSRPITGAQKPEKRFRALHGHSAAVEGRTHNRRTKDWGEVKDWLEVQGEKMTRSTEEEEATEEKRHGTAG